MAMDISQFKPAIVYTIYIVSTPEKVWQALTSAEFSQKYFFRNAVEFDLRVGGVFFVHTPDGSAPRLYRQNTSRRRGSTSMPTRS